MEFIATLFTKPARPTWTAPTTDSEISKSGMQSATMTANEISGLTVIKASHVGSVSL
jgi:hypothetical protein